MLILCQNEQLNSCFHYCLSKTKESYTKMFLDKWHSFLSKIYLRLILSLLRIFKWRVKWVAIWISESLPRDEESCLHFLLHNTSETKLSLFGYALKRYTDSLFSKMTVNSIHNLFCLFIRFLLEKMISC